MSQEPETTHIGAAFRKNILHSASVLALGAAISLTAATTASAQAAADAGSSDVSAVVVTGSRVVRNGNQAPTPVTVVTTEQLQATAPSSLSDSLNQLPAFKNSSTPASTGVGTTGNVAQSFLNLRSLGTQRTLILLNGQRMVPSSAAGAVDISVMPEGLVQRVDVVTGGASAAYGSDAVAGVVNFVLDTKFTGVKGLIQAGESTYSDYQNKKVQLTVGQSFLDGRAHVLISADYYDNKGVKHWADRPWFNSCSRISNPALNPSTVVACDVRSAGFTAGGLITAGPLKGTQFGNGGEVQPMTYGSLVLANSPLSMVGGGNIDNGRYFPVVPAVNRTRGYTRFSYDLTDNVSVYTDFLYAKADGHYYSTAPWEGQSTGFTIYKDNAYLPASIVSAMTAANITNFPLWRYNYDFGLLGVDSSNTTYRASLGADMKFGNWNVHAYYEHGANKFKETVVNNPQVNLEYNAADAVVNPANGQIVCRSTLTQPNNGCVPINLIGNGSPSAAALKYLLNTSQQDLLVKQDVVELNIDGTPFSLWAGPVTVGFGANYRKESSAQVVDAISTGIRNFTGGYQGWPTSLQGQLGGYERGNPQPVAGSFDVKEAYVEALVPLARDAPLIKALDLNGAFRYTDYSTSGGVKSWKVGLTYTPFTDLRFRGTRSRDIRAPNISELFTGATQGQGNLTDDFQAPGSVNRTPVVITRSFGNPNLIPETADTITVGGVYQPSWFEGFSFSLDYYNIDVKNAIGTLGGQTTIDQCFGGATQLCSLLHRDATGLLVSVDTPYLNIANRKTSGADIEMSYRMPLSRFSQSWDGSLSFRLLANYVDKLLTINPGAPVYNVAGETGPGATLGVPHWSGTLGIIYDRGPLNIYVQERYIGSGKLDASLPATTLAPASNHVDAVFYTDVTFTYKFKVDQKPLEAFLTINNAFNKTPPLAPSAYFVFGTSNGGTNPNLFDVVGRQFTMGMRFKF